MKKVLILAILVIVIIVPVTAKDTNGKDFGVGLSLGSPLVNLTAKYDIEQELAVCGGLGFGGGVLKVNGGVQYNFIDFSIEKLEFNVYAGGNLFIAFGNSQFGLGLDLLLGTSYYLEDPSIEFFVEVGLDVNLLFFQVGGLFGIGARYEL
ncbi:MAG: hypothetical protein KAQ69_00065, partial [Spirochaetales bacterium]|nr:hypothetical protein [Spirochaetales bacterium]